MKIGSKAKSKQNRKQNRNKKIAVESTGRFSKRALEWCKDIAKRQAERRRLPHLPDQNITNERGTYDPEAIKKFHYNVAEAQLELHRQNMEWCIGTIAKARHRHIDVEPEIDERNMIWGFHEMVTECSSKICNQKQTKRFRAPEAHRDMTKSQKGPKRGSEE